MKVGTLELSVEATNCEQVGELIARIRTSLDDANAGFRELAELLCINSKIDGEQAGSLPLKACP